MKKIHNKTTMEYIYLLIIFMMCVDQGDGHWKEKEIENLEHDIQQYEKMAEKIEREIESFYDKHPEERYRKDDIGRTQYKHVTNTIDREKEAGKDNTYKATKENNQFFTILNNISSSISDSGNYDGRIVKVTFKNNYSNKPESFDSPWPKFEDILLAIGKKYDWKNDRWIKVKGKLKETYVKTQANQVDNNSIQFHTKHKFSYRIVKLNKSKSRRNVVVAVSAVR